MRAFLACSGVLYLFASVLGCGDDSADTPPIVPPMNLGVGEACNANPECRTGLVCDESGTCQPAGTATEGSPCQLTGDCADGLFCGVSRTCEAAGTAEEGSACTTTADCVAGLMCSIEGFSAYCRPTGSVDLMQPCDGNGDCLAGLSCLPGAEGTSICTSPEAGFPSIPFWSGEDCGIDDESSVAYFRLPRSDVDEDFYRLPYPNDARRSGGGLDLTDHPSPGTALPLDIIDRYLRASEEDLDGFATNAVVFFRFSIGYDWDTVGEGSLRMVDVTPASPSYDSDVPLGRFTSFGPVSRYICPNWLAVRSLHGRPLLPATTYASIVTTDVKVHPDLGGGDFARDPDLDAMLSTSAPSDSALADAWAAYQPLRDWIADTAFDASTILNATVFTTQDPVGFVPRLRQAVRAEPLPPLTDLTVCDGSTTSPCEDADGRGACGPPNADYTEIHGRMAIPIFQHGTPPYETPEDGGGIQYGAALPTVARTEPVCFAMTVPNGPPPAGGFPLMVYGHGTGGAFTGAVTNGLAADVAAADLGGTPVNAATLAIDMPQHGSRRGGSTLSPDVLFFNFQNPRAARDNIMQGTADLLSVVYLATGLSLDAAASPTGEELRFDASRIAFFVHSQSATHAALMIPFEPDVSAVVLSGNGGDLTQSLLTKTEPVDIAGILPVALLDVGRDGTLATGNYHPALSLFQAYFERVDPVNYGRLYRVDPPMGNGRHVFMTYGLEDSFSTEPTLRAFALSALIPHVTPVLVDMGLGTVDPPVTDNVTIDTSPYTYGVRQYMATDGEDGHFVATRTTQGRADTIRFVLGALAGMSPAIGQP